jgi:hypothetical protein
VIGAAGGNRRWAADGLYECAGGVGCLGAG